MKKIRLLSLLFVATLFVQNATATYLPYSSHYQGRSYIPFNVSGVTGYVDFAVYDTHRLLGDEWTGAGFGLPGLGQYVYAYQIFNNVGSAKPIGSFTIMGINDPPIEHTLTGIDTINKQDPFPFQPFIAGRIEPSEWDFSQTRATWKFLDALNGATLVAGGYSWFLIFSSDRDWTAGSYLMQPEGGFPITGNPEPCTLALLGLGSAILFAKRRNSVKLHRVRSH
jgi:hypothetical protein